MPRYRPFFESYDPAYRWCRATQHIWQHPGMSLKKGDLNGALEYYNGRFIVTMKCVNCGAERVDKIVRNTGEVTRFYRLPRGYSLTKRDKYEELPTKTEWRKQHFNLLAESLGVVKKRGN